MNKYKSHFFKGILLSFLYIMGSVPVSAKCLVVTLTDGSLVYYYLSGDIKPVMKFSDSVDGFSITADNYMFSGIKNFFITTTDPAGIETVTNQKPLIKEGIISFIGERASLYTLDGKKVMAKVEKSGDMVIIDLSSLSKGIYIIKAGKTSFKVSK